jgi:predicted  nucleic acid-binding Zn-ribbon protein
MHDTWHDCFLVFAMMHAISTRVLEGAQLDPQVHAPISYVAHMPSAPSSATHFPAWLLLALAELDRLRMEVGGTRLELNGLQQQLQDKEALLQHALADAAASKAAQHDAQQTAAAEAKARQELQAATAAAQQEAAAAEARAVATEGRAAAAESRVAGLEEEQSRQLRVAAELREQVG